MPGAAAELPLLSVFFDDGAAAAVPVSLLRLDREPPAAIFPCAIPAGRSGPFVLFRAGHWLLGAAAAPVKAGLMTTAERLYDELLGAARERHLCRIWNYVPGINAPDPDGLENYRAFSWARSLAFERHYGSDFKRRLPAASAVGTEGDRLAVVFAASSHRPRHCENPVQMPAYDYPPVHGPRPPSFSRTTLVSDGATADVFVSGTAAIKGHDSLAAGDTRCQLGHTLDNLRSISRVAGLGDDLGAGRCAARHWQIYLRHAADYPEVAATLASELLRPGDSTNYLRADICRAALNVEIEATVLGVRPVQAGPASPATGGRNIVP
jgi:hypothetical protein